jgi:ubiquilin
MALQPPAAQPTVPQQPQPNDFQQRQQNMLQLFEQMQQLQAAMGGFPQPSPFAMPPIIPAATSPLTPAAGSSMAAAATTPAADVEPPEVRFKDQLKSMEEMGFTDKSKNIKALLAAVSCYFRYNWLF